MTNFTDDKILQNDRHTIIHMYLKTSINVLLKICETDK